MRRTLMICMIAALAAFPLMAGAQQSGTMGPTYEEEQMKGHLMPKDAHPNLPSSEAMPSEVRPQDDVVQTLRSPYEMPAMSRAGSMV